MSSRASSYRNLTEETNLVREQGDYRRIAGELYVLERVTPMGCYIIFTLLVKALWVIILSLQLFHNFQYSTIQSTGKPLSIVAVSLTHLRRITGNDLFCLACT